MKLAQRLLPFGCALAMVCLIAARPAAGQSSGVIANRVTQKPDPGQRITLTGNVHPLALAEFSRGAVADAQPIDRILLLLKRSDAQEAALKSLVDAQQDKSSPNYHAWLTPEEFGQKFGPSDQDIQALTDWLNAQGFRNVRVAAGRTVVEFSGTAGQVREALSTTLQNYQVDGSLYVANASDPQIPAALAPVVFGIVSLNNFPRKPHSNYRGDATRKAGGGMLQPQFTFPSPFFSGTFYGVGPGDFATIYNTKALVGSGTDGSGVTIGIVGETEIDPKDVSDFRSIFGLSNNFSAANVILNGEDPGITSKGEESESDLDVQWSGAVAPGATVKFVLSASTPASAGVDLSALYIVEHNLADIVSESYGECESNLGTAGNAFFNSLWEQAAAQGITVVVSSGDSGSAGCDNPNTQTTATHGLAVSGLSGTPFNVSVGGTDFNQFNSQTTYWNNTNDAVTGTSAKGYIPEFPWNQNCSQLGLTGCGSTAPNGSVNLVAGGGGASKVYGKPTWQMGVTGVPNDNHRDQPDIALFASPGFEGSGYLFCQADLTGVSSCNLNSPEYTFHIIGGTSASAPAFAGMMALVDQYSAAHGGSKRQGNANVTLYALAKKASASCASSTTEAAGCVFHDVVAPNIHFPNGAASNGVACKGGTPNCSATVATTNGVLVDPAHTTAEAWTAGAGYDLATGLGSLNANNLVTMWGGVSTIATTTTLALTPTTGIAHGSNENVSVTVNVKPNTGTGVTAGDVALIATLADGSTLGLDQFTLSNGAISSAKTQSLPGGTYTAHAHYAGDGTNAPSDSASVSVTVGKEASQAFIVVPTFDISTGNQISGNATTLSYGTPYIIRLYATNGLATASTTGPPNGACYTVNLITCPTGTMSLTANGAGLDGGNFTVNNEGYTRDISPTLGGGTWSLMANYSGDGSYDGSTSATDTLTITPVATTIGPGNPPLPSQVATPFGLSATLRTGPLSVSPVAPSCNNVTFYDGATALSGTVFCTSQTGGGGFGAILQPSLIVSQATSGVHTYTAKFNGDANYAASTSAGMPTRVFEGTTTSLSADSSNVQYGTSITLTAVVDSSVSQGPALSQLVSFSFNNSPITGTVTYTPFTDSSGNLALRAVLSNIPQSSGFYTATFAGDSVYFQSGALVNINVNIPDFSVAANFASTSITAGNSATAMITITPASNASSPVALACPTNGGTPPGISCSLSPATVNLANGAPVTSTLTLTTLAPSSSNSTSSAPLVLPYTYSPPLISWPFAVTSMIALVALLMVMAARLRRRVASLARVACGACLFLSLCGCGGGSAGGGGGGGGPVPTSIVLTASSVRAPASVGLNLSAKISSSKTAAGTVTFYVDGFALVSIPVLGGVAQTPAILGVGVHSVSAKYSGDANTLGSQTNGSLNIAATGPTGVAVNASTGALFHGVGVNFNLQ